jgi:hypothetical protein
MREDMSDEAENWTITCSSFKRSLKIRNNEMGQYVFGVDIDINQETRISYSKQLKQAVLGFDSPSGLRQNFPSDSPSSTHHIPVLDASPFVFPLLQDPWQICPCLDVHEAPRTSTPPLAIDDNTPLVPHHGPDGVGVMA